MQNSQKMWQLQIWQKQYGEFDISCWEPGNLKFPDLFCPNYTWLQLEIYRWVILHDTLKWCKICRKPARKFQKKKKKKKKKGIWWILKHKKIGKQRTVLLRTIPFKRQIMEQIPRYVMIRCCRIVTRLLLRLFFWCWQYNI